MQRTFSVIRRIIVTPCFPLGLPISPDVGDCPVPSSISPFCGRFLVPPPALLDEKLRGKLEVSPKIGLIRARLRNCALMIKLDMRIHAISSGSPLRYEDAISSFLSSAPQFSACPYQAQSLGNLKLAAELFIEEGGGVTSKKRPQKRD